MIDGVRGNLTLPALKMAGFQAIESNLKGIRMTTTNQTFDGLAFPVAKVRYTGSGYAASIYRDRDRVYRARVSYDHSIGGGARGALPAALKAFGKALADNDGLAREGDYVAVPGDFDDSYYTFTFVPAHFFNGH